MTNDVFKQPEFAALLQRELSKLLPPLFLLHHELLKRAGMGVISVRVPLDDLAAAVGCSIDELQSRLNDLASLHFITSVPGRTNDDARECHVALLVKP